MARLLPAPFGAGGSRGRSGWRGPLRSEVYREGRALVYLALDRQVAAVLNDNAVNLRQTQA